MQFDTDVSLILIDNEKKKTPKKGKTSQQEAPTIPGTRGPDPQGGGKGEGLTPSQKGMREKLQEWFPKPPQPRELVGFL